MPDTVLAIVGLWSLGFGLALLSVPVSLIVVGAVVLLYAVLPDQTDTDRAKDRPVTDR